MKTLALLGATALITSTASAAITGLDVVYNGVLGGKHVYSVYALSNSTVPGQLDVMLNMIGHNIVSGAMTNVGHTGNNTWAPSATDTAAEDLNDSYVTVDGLTANAGPNYSAATTVTALDPSFSPSTGSTIPANAGWFTSAPATDILITGGRIRIMQIAGTNLLNSAVQYTARLNIGYKKQGTTSPLYMGDKNYTIGAVPAPGALALLGLAGAFGRRRR